MVEKRKQIALWVGRVLSALPILELTTSASMKLAHSAPVVETMVGKFGFPERTLTKIGLLEIACAVLYAIPRTAVLGAILFTAFLGGAVVTNVRVGDAFVLPIALGVAVWVGLYLRDERLRVLVAPQEDRVKNLRRAELTTAVIRWRPAFWLAAVGFVAVAIAFSIHGVGEAGVRLGIRLTARISVASFIAVFIASATNSLFRAPWTKWLLKSRRALGVGFAAVHLTHGALVLALALLYTRSFFATTTTTSRLGGLFGYAWLLAMVATSFDRPAAAIGKRAWRILHKGGLYVLWFLLLVSFHGITHAQPLYWIPVALLLAAWAVRVVAWIRRPRRKER